jgi:type I restriction enzyme S subunit
MSVRIPRDAKVQQAIENVLGAIDDRISLLRETNTTLEAIAQALFKSWFVDFDPVHAKIQGLAPEGVDEATAALFPDSFEESELGPLPKGWKWMSLNDAYEINPTRKLKKGDTAAYLDMAGVQTQGHSVSGVVQREMGSGTKFMNGDTLLARITPCLENGKTAFVDFLPADQTGWGSTEFVVLRPKDPLPKYHAYLLARHPAFREHAIRSMSGTSGRQRIQNDVLSQFLVAVPNEPIAKAFSELVMTIHESIREGHLQVSTLSELRDTLLPRLISGRVDLQAATTSKPVEV